MGQSAAAAMHSDLPLRLGDGLVLHWATRDDIDPLAQFNIRVHSDNADQPEAWLGDWTRDLMSGDHPTTSFEDFTVVVDSNHGRKIVSSLCLISQQWTFEKIPFGVGRIELVGTDPAYRRRGLVRRQMEVIHKLSAANGELIQAITGIPWYYRQFGYEMALNLDGGRKLFWARPGNDKNPQNETFDLRPAAPTDIPLLQELFKINCERSLLRLHRTRAEWAYGMFTATSATPGKLRIFIFENELGQGVGYARYWAWGTNFVVREMAVKPGISWRQASLTLIHRLKTEADKMNNDREEAITNIHFNFGETHPVYDALGKQLEYLHKPYAWYIRIPDLKRFLEKIGPVLARRLAQSVMAGYAGNLRLSFYRDGLRLVFENGRMLEVVPYEPSHVEDADAFFPDRSFLQLLLGYRSFDELDYAFADCYAKNEETAILLRSLFPRQPTDISPL